MQAPYSNVSTTRTALPSTAETTAVRQSKFRMTGAKFNRKMYETRAEKWTNNPYENVEIM